MLQSREARSRQTNMQPALQNQRALRWASEFGATCLGRVCSVSQDGRLWVDFPGNLAGPVVSLCLHGACLDEKALAGEVPVLLVFEHGDPGRPIIVGTVRSTVATTAGQQRRVPDAVAKRGPIGDSDVAVVTSTEEITLICGKS